MNTIKFDFHRFIIMDINRLERTLYMVLKLGSEKTDFETLEQIVFYNYFN